MVFVRVLSEEEEAELRRMTRQEIGRVSQRAQMILLSAQQRTVPEIAEIFGVSRATVRHWIAQFEQRGPTGLYDEPRMGRPRKMRREQEPNRQLEYREPAKAYALLAAFCTLFVNCMCLGQVQLQRCR